MHLILYYLCARLYQLRYFGLFICDKHSMKGKIFLRFHQSHRNVLLKEFIVNEIYLKPLRL